MSNVIEVLPRTETIEALQTLGDFLASCETRNLSERLLNDKQAIAQSARMRTRGPWPKGIDAVVMANRFTGKPIAHIDDDGHVAVLLTIRRDRTAIVHPTIIPWWQAIKMRYHNLFFEFGLTFDSGMLLMSDVVIDTRVIH